MNFTEAALRYGVDLGIAVRAPTQCDLIRFRVYDALGHMPFFECEEHVVSNVPPIWCAYVAAAAMAYGNFKLARGEE